MSEKKEAKAEKQMKLMDYIDWRGDISLSYSPFNVVDNLILSELAYVNMETIVSSDLDFEYNFAQLLARYRVARLDQMGAHNNPIPLLEKIAYCERFKNITIGGHINYFDEESATQFSAVTYKLDDGTLYVAFRGTDHTMTGWREDFNFGYMTETPGQKKAVEYLEAVCRKHKCKVYVGGHSKGGNFAVYAATYASDDIKNDLLINVFSNDGPGLIKSIVESDEYLAITDKIIKTVPESSIIGMLLFGKEKVNVVASDGKGLDQHSPYNWYVTKDGFVPVEDLTYKSEVLDSVMDEWVEALDKEKRGIVISTLFSAIDAAGYTSMNDILENKLSALNAITKASKSLDEEERKITMDSLKMLASISKDVLWDDAKKKFMHR